MFDFHTHILPQIDDGSRSVQQSLAMLKELQNQQIEFVVATPHFDLDECSLNAFLRKRKKAFQSLWEEPGNLSTLPQVILGAEVVFYDNFFYMIEGLESLCIGDTHYMLLELSTEALTESILTGLNNLILSRGIIPIIAHAERYWSWRSTVKNMKLLTEIGALIQMNAEFVLQPFTRKRALGLIQEGVIHVLGSDCHNMSSRKPNIGLAYQHIRNKLGSKAIQRLTKNGQQILKNRSLSTR